MSGLKFLGLVLLVFAFAACSSTPTNADSTDAGATANDVGGNDVVSSPAFPEPPLAVNASKEPGTFETQLTAEAADVTLIPGKTTHVYVYNGSVPGPTLDLVEGQHVVIHFTNKLPEPTTIHWHGLHIPAAQDGHPSDPIAPGASHDYVFDIPKGSAGLYWYHPHPEGKTASQVSMGLAGMIRVHPVADPHGHDLISAEFPDHLVILSDNKLDAQGQIAADTQIDQINGREGDLLLVNGAVKPTLTVQAGQTQRLRIINASAARYYLLAIPGHTLTQIGSDGGLLTAPVPQSQILLSPAERVEVLVAMSGSPGTTTTLQALPYNRGAMDPNTMGTLTSAQLDLMNIQYTADQPIAVTTIPTSLAVVKPIDVSKATTREIKLTEDMMNKGFFINGKKYDGTRVDSSAALGSTEIWSITNKGDMDHPFHLHGFPFQILDRNGTPEPFVAWKDTFNIRKNEIVRIAMQFNDFPGRWLYHCHILEHEELGMMGTLEVK
jgi:FtsP/CotA-like multicopper oxidase with cupredoxin domain